MVRRSAYLIVVLLVLLIPLSARQDDGWTATVHPDRVSFGPSGSEVEYIPRIGGGPNDLVVPAGQTFVVPPGAQYEHVEVFGTLACPSVVDATVTTVIVMPGGRWICGTPEAPATGTIRIRDSLVDVLGTDPHQMGTGILNAGHRQFIGMPKTGWARLTGDVAADATVIPITSPADWQLGDEITITDSRQMGWNGSVWESPRRDGPFTIIGITANSITISTPLAFSRTAMREPDGEVVDRALVQNRTRSVKIVSQNPAGTRGHLMDVGNAASFDERYVEHRGMGRTCDGTLDPLTCHAGRYGGVHAHHLGDGAGSQVIGSSFIGVPGVKWSGVILHDTDNVLIERTLCTESSGWCNGTEEGTEEGWVFRSNVASYTKGNAVPNEPHGVEMNFAEGRPGTEGSGFGLRGINGTFEDNETWNNEIGTNLLALLRFVNNVPQDADRFVFRTNRDYANRVRGEENWGVGEEFLIQHPTAAYNGETQIWSGGAGFVKPHLRDVRAIASLGRSECIHGNGAYVTQLIVIGGEIRGCHFGVSNGVAVRRGLLQDLVMQNVVNIDLETLSPYDLLMDSVDFEDLPGHPRRWVVTTTSPIWQPGQPFPSAPYVSWSRQRGPKSVFLNWDRSGQDYDLVFPGQERSVPAWYSTDPVNHFNFVPAVGLTMGQAFDQFGLALLGDVYASGEATALSGLVGGALARSTALRNPRPLGVVITAPSVHAPAQATQFDINVTLTGPYDPTTRRFCIQGPADPAPYCSGIVYVEDSFILPRVQLPVGTHSRAVWRIDGAGIEIAGTRRTQTFCVVACDGQPPPVEICGNGIDDDGDGFIDEGCAPPPEICGDGIDNDGDGFIDEGCGPQPGCVTGGSVSAFGSLWTMSADRPNAQTLRDGVQFDRGIDSSEPYGYVFTGGKLFVESLGIWHVTDGSRWITFGTIAPTCGG